MDFSFVNEFLNEDITLVDRQLQPCRRTGLVNRYGHRQLQNMLYEIVDAMGIASAKAQGLRGSITTGKKLELAGQRLYIMKDSDGNGGKGSVVGILKVGTKKLFVYDDCKVQHELEPLCVLDFYVHESRQRMGCGKKLFSYMLQCEGIPAHHLAVDRPSQKFSSFLQKHYSLKSTIPQVNNFVIFDGFFGNRSDFGGGKRRNGADGRPPVNPLRPSSGQSRFSVNNIGRNGYNQTSQNQPNQSRNTINEDALNKLNLPKSPLPQPNQNGSMAAGDMMYSRHGPSPPNSRGRSTPPNPQLHRGQSQDSHRGQQNQRGQSNQAQRPISTDSNRALTNRYNNGTSSGHIYAATGMAPQAYSGQASHNSSTQNNNRDASYRNHGNGEGRSSNSRARDASPYYKAPETPPANPQNVGYTPPYYQATPIPTQKDVRSMSQYNQGRRQTPPNQAPRPQNQESVIRTVPSVGDQNSTKPQSATHLPDIANQNSSAVKQRPPSGKKTQTNKQVPPNPQQDYKDMLNMHQNFQGRSGHLRVTNGPPLIPGMTVEKMSPFTPNGPSQRDNTWTVGNYLNTQKLSEGLSSRNYSHRRLW